MREKLRIMGRDFPGHNDLRRRAGAAAPRVPPRPDCAPHRTLRGPAALYRDVNRRQHRHRAARRRRGRDAARLLHPGILARARAGAAGEETPGGFRPHLPGRVYPGGHPLCRPRHELTGSDQLHIRLLGQPQRGDAQLPQHLEQRKFRPGQHRLPPSGRQHAVDASAGTYVRTGVRAALPVMPRVPYHLPRTRTRLLPPPAPNSS